MTVGELDRGQVGDDRVGQTPRVIDGLNSHENFGLDLLVEFYVDLEGALNAAHERFDLDAGRAFLGNFFVFNQEKRIGLDKLFDLRASFALDEHFDRAIGKAKELHDRADGADRKNVLGCRLVCLGVTLRGEENFLAAIHGFVERGDGTFTPDEELRDHVRKDDDVSKRQKGCNSLVWSGFATIAVVLEEHPDVFLCSNNPSSGW